VLIENEYEQMKRVQLSNQTLIQLNINVCTPIMEDQLNGLRGMYNLGNT
jgi:hypothetical protein